MEQYLARGAPIPGSSGAGGVKVRSLRAIRVSLTFPCTPRRVANNSLRYMSAPPSGFERFAKFLAADISAETVYTETESDTIWIESVAGRMFELDQNASIRDCYPGSFPEIDSYDENYFTKNGRRRAVISLKVVYCSTKGEFEAKALFNKIWTHLKALSRFRGASGNLLPKAGGGRCKVEIAWEDFDIAVLRVAVPKSVYKANKTFFTETKRYPDRFVLRWPEEYDNNASLQIREEVAHH